jgi:hypothetical protein
MPQILLTGQLIEKPTNRVLCLYSSFAHGAFLRKGSSFAHLLANQDKESSSSTSVADPGAFLTPGSGNPGSGIHIQDQILESLVYIFWDKILKFFVADPDPVLFDPGSGINIPDRIRNAVSKGS